MGRAEPVSAAAVSDLTWDYEILWTRQKEAGVEFRVLGSLQVIGPDALPIDLPSASQRRLISLLLVRGAVVSADSLAEHLGLSPGALRTTVSRLRRILGFGT